MHAHNVCTHTQTGLQCEPQLVAQAKTPRPLGILGSIISSDRSGGRLGRWNLVGLGGLSMAGVSHATTVIVLDSGSDWAFKFKLPRSPCLQAQLTLQQHSLRAFTTPTSINT